MEAILVIVLIVFISMVKDALRNPNSNYIHIHVENRIPIEKKEEKND